MRTKKLLVPVLCAALLPALPVFAEDDAAAAAAALLEDVRGTYEALFPVITAPEYDQIWLDSIIPVIGEEDAPAFIMKELTPTGLRQVSLPTAMIR